MKPSSLRMRAISVFNFEAGTSTFGWRAWIALRTRVSMSAMGSLVIVLLLHLHPGYPRPRGASGPRISLPARLDHAGDLAVEGELAEAKAADAEFAQERARPAAAPAAVAMPGRQFCDPGLSRGLSGLRVLTDLLQFQVFRDLGGSGHSSSNPFDAEEQSRGETLFSVFLRVSVSPRQ